MWATESAMEVDTVEEKQERDSRKEGETRWCGGVITRDTLGEGEMGARGVVHPSC